MPHAATRAAIAFALAALFTGMSPGAAAQATAPLQDQNGHAFGLQQLHGTPVVLTFVASHCVDACPIINAQFQAMQTQLRRSGLRVHLLTLSLDPENDHAADMQRIARTFSADPRYWTVGSGSVQTGRALMRQFGVVANRGSRRYADIHTTYVYLIDRHGRLVKTILASSNLPADLFAELQRTWNQLTA